VLHNPCTSWELMNTCIGHKVTILNHFAATNIAMVTEVCFLNSGFFYHIAVVVLNQAVLHTLFTYMQF